MPMTRAFLVLLALPLYISPVKADTLLQNISVDVIDGDTLRITGTKEKIRLLGIDACETRQTATTKSGQTVDCGEPATSALIGLTIHQPVTCSVTGRDRYKRLLARCGTSTTPDLGAELVRQGLAVVYRYKGKPTVPDYVAIESRAQSSQLGLWALNFDEPFLYRRAK